MSYKNDLRFVIARQSDEELDELEIEYRDRPPKFDSRDGGDRELAYPLFWLPHSCDEWVIGGVEEAESLTSHLLEFIRQAKEAGH